MAITRTQKGSNSAAGSGATLGVSLTGIAVGSLLAIGTSWDTTAATTGSTVTDDLAVAATGKATSDPGTAIVQTVEIWYYKNYGGGSRTVTLNNSPAQTFRAIAVVEVAGADTVTPLGGIAHNSGNSASPASGNISPAPTLAGNYALGIVANAQATAPTFAAPFADVFNSTTGDGSDTEDLLQAVAANISATWTQASANWAACCAGFNPASSGATWYPTLSRARLGPFDLRQILSRLRFDYTPSPVIAPTFVFRMRDLDGLSGQGAPMKNPLE